MSHLKLISGYIATEVVDDVAVIRIDRPQSLNALNADTRRDIASAIRHFGTGEQIRGIVLTGTGRAFSSGEDLYSVADSPEQLLTETELFHDMSRAALDTYVPTVAAINGIAVGGSAEFTLSFDARIGSETAEYYFPENRRGLVISNGASYLLPRIVGSSRAMRTVLSADRIDASRALTIGLLDEVARTNLVERAVELIHEWTGEGAAYREHVQLLRPPRREVEDAFRRESEGVRSTIVSGIAAAGMSSFVERAR